MNRLEPVRVFYKDKPILNVINPNGIIQCDGLRYLYYSFIKGEIYSFIKSEGMNFTTANFNCIYFQY